MTRPAHTALPWTVERYGDGDSLVIHSDEVHRVCFMATPGKLGSQAVIEANAALIVRAVNCHDELVKALEAILAKHKGLFGDPPHELAGCDLQDIERAYAALARAKGAAT